MKKRPRAIVFIGYFCIVMGILAIKGSIPWQLLFISLQNNGFPDGEAVRIAYVKQNSPAQSAGLQSGDIVEEVNGEKLASVDEFIKYFPQHAGESVVVTINRMGEKKNITVIPRVNPPEGEGSLGVNINLGTTFKQESVVTLIPHVLFKGYSGYEIKEPPGEAAGMMAFMTNSYTFYQDTSYMRLRNLILGIFEVIIGIGLIKLRRFALYGYYIFAALNLLFLFSWISEIYHSGQILESYNLYYFIFSLIVEFVLFYLVYKNRKVFS